jgi:uncharacterized protein (DUF58 family)
VSGFVFVFITVFLAVGAVNSQNNLLFWVFGVAVAAVLVSGLISGNSLMGVRLAAGEIPETPVGAVGRIPYTVVSRNRLLPVFGMTIREHPARQTDAGCAVHVEPLGRAEVAGIWRPGVRGRAAFDRVLVESRFPFGFIVKTLEFSVPREGVATPARIPLRASVIASLGEGQTEHRVKRARRGAVGTYFGLRAYAPGDPRRLIAWRPTARRSELLVVEHAEPQGRSIWLHLPRPPAVRDGDPLAERAIALASSLMHAGSESGRSVGVWAPWAGLRIAPARGPWAERRVDRALALVDLSAPMSGDSAPPARPGDSVITLPMTAGAGSGPDRLDPSRPEDWLAPGAELPAALAASGVPAADGRAGVSA